MTLKNHWLPILSLIFINQTTLGQTKLAQKHHKILSAIQYLSVDFEQEIYSDLRKKTRLRQGKAKFSKPGSFKWAFKHKTHGDETFYFDGQTLSHYLSRDNTVTHYGHQAGFSQELKQIVDMVLDPDTLLLGYDSVPQKKTNNILTYHLTPKKQNSDIRVLVIRLPEKKPYIQEVAITYKDGNKSTYRFRNPVPSKIPSKTFRFQNPGGVKEKRVG